MCKKTLSVLLVAALLSAGVPAAATSAETEPSRSAAIRSQLELAGVGHYVQFQLTDRSKHVGRIEALGEEEFQVASAEPDAPSTVRYADVRKVKKLKKWEYRAQGTPDPALARQAVEILRVGTHVMAKTPQQTYRGHIQAIEDDSFTVRLDGTHKPQQIPYSEVLQVKENSDAAFVILALAVGGVIGYLLATRR